MANGGVGPACAAPCLPELRIGSDALFPGASWRCLASAAPWRARCDLGVAAVPCASAAETLLLLGGVNRAAWCYGDTWASKDGGAAWSLVAEAGAGDAWAARSGHVLVADGGRLLLLGGAGRDRCFRDVWASDDAGRSWQQRTAEAPWAARYGHRVARLPSGRVLLSAGAGLGGFLGDVWGSDDFGESWSRILREMPEEDEDEEESEAPQAPWRRRAAHAMVAVGGAVLLMAGMGDDGPLGDVWRSLDGGETWTPAPAPWPARSGPAVVALPAGRVLLLGGFDGRAYLGDIWSSDDAGAVWSRVLASAPWPPRYCAAATALPAGRLLLLGGHGASGKSALGDVWESPDRREVRRHAVVLLLVGRRLEVAQSRMPRDAWAERVVPCLLPLALGAL